MPKTRMIQTPHVIRVRVRVRVRAVPCDTKDSYDTDPSRDAIDPSHDITDPLHSTVMKGYFCMMP